MVSNKVDLYEQLVLSERRRKEAQRLSGVGFWELDLKENSLYWSEEIYEIYEISELLQPSYEIFLSLIHDDDRERVNEAYRGSVQTGREYNIRYRVKAGGSAKWIEARGVTYYDEAGVPERSIGTAQDISEIMLVQHKIEHLAYHDELTGLPNRRNFSERIEEAIKLAERIGIKIAILFIDIDNFKLINDRHGHAAGDELLIGIGHRLLGSSRKSDVFARVGGDEFAGIMFDVGAGRVEHAVQKLKRAIEGVYDIHAGSFAITASIGVTIYPSDCGESEVLLRHADLAMYEAKEKGKSRVEYFDFDEHHLVQLRRQMLLNLEVAIERSELELFFQPRISLKDGAPSGAEALLRWFRPEGAVAPADIVKAIGGSHLEWALDAWVIECQLRHVKGFLGRGINGPFSLNVCPSTIENSNFPELLASLLSRSDVPGREIEIEILEVSSINNFERTNKILRQCKALGVSFSLDDFGTGYSSLTHFHSLPVDKLKIDQSFIRSIESNSENLTLVKSILAIAQTNRRLVVAEGVESATVARSLANLGCDYAQGYAISRPMKVNDYVSWVENWDASSFLNL